MESISSINQRTWKLEKELEKIKQKCWRMKGKIANIESELKSNRTILKKLVKVDEMVGLDEDGNEVFRV